MSCRRRVTSWSNSSWFSRAGSSGRGRACSPKRAITWASMRSVLGQNSQTLRIIPDLTGIDDGDWISGLHQFDDQSSFVSPGGLHHDQTFGRRRQPVEQLLESRIVVRQRERSFIGGKKRVEGLLGHVDANNSDWRVFHRNIPDLPMRARGVCGGASAPAAVRATFQRPATIPLRHGVLSTQAQSICRRPLCGSLLATLRSLPHSSLQFDLALGLLKDTRHKRPRPADPITLSRQS